MKPRHLLLSSALALTLASTLASAQSVSTASIIGVSNLRYATEDSLSIVSLFSADNAVSFTSGEASQSFGGNDRDGNRGTMSYSASGYGQSEYGRLRAYTTATLENSFFNEENAPYFNTQTQELDPNGTPDYFDNFAAARFTDTLQYGGQLQSGYGARYVFHVDGLVSGDALSSASLQVQIATNDAENASWVFPQGNVVPQPYTRSYATQTYAINGQTAQSIFVAFATATSISTEQYGDGVTVSGTSNFTSTAVLDRIEIVDAAGNLVSGVTVTSGSGTAYRVAAVPEPASTAALAIGGLGYIVRRRRRRC